MTLLQAIEAAMEDWLKNNREFTPHNPCVGRWKFDKEDYDYRSSCHKDFEPVIGLEETAFGMWEPETPDEIPECAEGFAKDVGIEATESSLDYQG